MIRRFLSIKVTQKFLGVFDDIGVAKVTPYSILVDDNLKAAPASVLIITHTRVNLGQSKLNLVYIRVAFRLIASNIGKELFIEFLGLFPHP